LALEGALAIAVAVPGAGELEADPGLADHLHEPAAHPVAVRPRRGSGKVGLWTQRWICREFVEASKPVPRLPLQLKRRVCRLARLARIPDVSP
jgi:hypothetical protein